MYKKFPIKIIVGANYGDEGKGLATNYFSDDTTLNILTNGGPQRGHTVVLESGINHVFHHFGSGFFRGADTYMAKTFMVNPAMFCEEYKELAAFHDKQQFFIDPQCKLITMYDMMINQIVELSRGNNRDGSCGLGIWETVKRNDDIQLTVNQFAKMNDSDKFATLDQIRKYYLRKLATEYNITMTDEYVDLFNTTYFELDKHYIADFTEMYYRAKIMNFSDLIKIHGPRFTQLVCENAQGLALDWDQYEAEDHHVTASYTGAKSVVAAYSKIASEIEIVYITRTYFTRHGAGKLPNECDHPMDLGITNIDETNVPNDWQGTIRYAPFDSTAFLQRVNSDWLDVEDNGVKTTLSLFVTHMNELTDKMHFEFDHIAKYFNNVYLSDTEYSVKTMDIEAFFNKHKDDKLWNEYLVPSYGRGIIFFYDKYKGKTSNAVIECRIYQAENQTAEYWWPRINEEIRKFNYTQG